MARAKASLLFGAVILALSSLRAQVSPPSVNEISPMVNTEVSSMIQTGSGYDAWTGSVHRSVTDLEVPGAVSSLGLKWVRTYNSGGNSGVLGWSFSWTWRYWGRGWGSTDPIAVYLPDGGLWRTNEPGMKLRWDKTCPCGPGQCAACTTGDAYLHLEDGSTVHMDYYGDPPECEQTPPRCYWIDDYTPTYVDDPYGRRTTLDYEEACVFGYDDDGATKRLRQVTDPSGRYIRITYAYDAADCQHNTTSNWWKPLRVEGSDGSWVNYTWDQSNAGYLTHVDYSDGTHADYTYGNTTYNWDTVCCDEHGNNCHNCTIPGNATKLIAAWDTHADSPMQSIDYEYKTLGSFQGQIRTEHQLLSASPTASPIAGATVSTFTSNSCPTHPWSQSPDCPSATQSEARGDGPSRTIYLEQATQHVPLVKRKSDFNGINEVYTYDTNNYLLTAQDRNGNLTTYTNESVVGNPTRILHNADGTHIDYAYSDNANPYHIRTVTDELGKVTTYTRGGVPGTNLANLITRIDYPSDTQTPASYETFSYNNFGQVLTHQLKNLAYESFVYGTSGLLTDRYNPKQSGVPGGNDPHTHYDYYGPNDPVGGNAWIDRLKKVTLPPNYYFSLQASETYEYDRALGADGTTDPNGTPMTGRGLVTKITHGDNTYQSFGYDAFGNKRWEENELRQRTSYTYDGYKRVLTVTNPLNKTSTNDYAPTQGDQTQCYQHTSNSPYWVTTPALITTHNLYDGNWRRTSTTAAYGTLNLTTTFGYDNVGNLTSATDPRTYQTQHGYDNRNRKTSTTEAFATSLQRTTTWHYDAVSNVTGIDRPDITTETKTYDAMHRVLTDTVPKSANPAVSIVTTFNYNPSGTLNWVKDGEGHTYNFAYDAADRKLSMTYPSTGGPTSTQSWAYDNAGNMQERITAGGEGKIFYYDIRNRNVATWWSNYANNIVDWRYLGYDAASHLIEAENGTGGYGGNVISDVTRNYDAAGHLTLEQQKVTGVGTTVAVNYPTFDDDGRLTRMYVTAGGAPLTLGAGYDFTYSYDAMGRFEKIFLTNSSQLFQYYYDATSNEIERDNLNNLVKQIYPRDALNRMQYVDVKIGNNQAFGHEGYSYTGPDGAMDRLTSVDYGNGHSDSFGYYLDGELNSAQLGNFNRNVTYTLNNAGNRTSVLDTGVTNTYTPDAINEYSVVTGHSISNGPEHEISGFDGVNYSYINDERLSSVTSGSNTYSLVYDALGRCVKRTLTTPQQGSIRPTPTARPTPTGPPPRPTPTPTASPSPELSVVSTYYLYDGEKPILEVDGDTGDQIGINVYGKGIDEILERVAVGSDNLFYTYFFQQNHEGSVTYLTEPTDGHVIEQYRYDVFGAPTIYDQSWNVRPSTAYDNRFLFTGREYAATYRSAYNTPAFNFYEYRARAYNPALGRFMSEDPKLFVRRIPLTKSPDEWSFDAHPAEGEFNLFRYCHNDPLDLTDPMGLDATRDFIAGVGDMVTFGQGEKVAEFLYPGYTATVDKGSAAYQLGSAGGIVAGMFNGKGEVSLGKKLLSTAGKEAGAAIKTEQAAGRSFREILKDFKSNSGDWVQKSAHTEPLKKGEGASIQTIWENKKTGEQVITHTRITDRGKVLEEHPRPMYKPRQGE